MYLTTRQGQVPPPPRQASRTTLPQPSASPTGPAQPITVAGSDQTVDNAISAEIDAFFGDNTVPEPEFTQNIQASLVFDSFNGCQLENTAELAEIDQPRAGDLSMIDFSGASPATPTVSNSTLHGDGGVPFDPQQFNSSVAQGGAPNVTIRGHVNNI